jgi:hypothetical protein
VSSHNDAKTSATDEENEEEDHHKKIFYEQLQLYYSTDNQRRLMGWKQLNDSIEVVKGDISHMMGDSRQATLYYKYKTDFAVLLFGDHNALVKSQHVAGKSVIDISIVPRYACYKELWLHKAAPHWSGGTFCIRITEASVKRHCVNISREMCEKFINVCWCQLDHKNQSSQMM